MHIVNSLHAKPGHGLGSDAYLKRLYHPPKTLFCNIIIDVKCYLCLIFHDVKQAKCLRIRHTILTINYEESYKKIKAMVCFSQIELNFILF